jgi:hypothetical protein
MTVSFYKKMLLFLICTTVFWVEKLAAQPVGEENIEYDFYNFCWTGLTGDRHDFEDGVSPSELSRTVREAVPTAKCKDADLERAFLPHYLHKTVPRQEKVSRFAVLNFIVRDSQVMTLHCFFMDSSNRIHRYWTMVEKGHSDDFRKLGERMRDSMKPFFKDISFVFNTPPSPTERAKWEQIFKDCLLPSENAFLSNLAMTNPTDKSFKGDFDAETCMLAVGHYLKYNNAKYFNEFVSLLNKDASRKKRFETKYKRIWMLANALKEFHNIKTYLQVASTNARKRDEFMGKATESKKLFKTYAVDLLPITPLEPKERKKESKIWVKYQKEYNLDSLSNMLERAARLISTCENMLAIADSAERNKELHNAIRLYMDVLRNEDVTNILSNFGDGGANCSDLKKRASNQVRTLRDTLKQWYLDTLHLGDLKLAAAKTMEDTLAAMDLYTHASRLNNDLSGVAALKKQGLYMQLGDNIKDCSQLTEAEEHYKRGILVADTKLRQQFHDKLVKVKQRKYDCERQNAPLSIDWTKIPRPTELSDTIAIKIDTSSTDRDKQFLADEIGNIFYKNVTGNTRDMSLAGKIPDFKFKNGKAVFSLEVQTDKVKSVLNEMSFPLGEYVGDPYIEQQVVEKLVQSIQEVYYKRKEAIASITVYHSGSADHTRFKSKCVSETKQYTSTLKQVTVKNCGEETNNPFKFYDLACSTNNDDKNLALAYLRAHRRRVLMEQILGANIPVKYELCGQVSADEGAQHRFVNTRIEIVLKKEFTVLEKIKL